DLQTLHCIRDGTTWKVLEQLNTFEDFLRDLVDAPNLARRLQLLSEHPDLISNDLMIALYPGQIEFVIQYDFDKGIDLYDLASEIETRLGHKAQIADLLNAMPIRFGAHGDQNRELEYYLKSVEVREQLPEKDRASGNYIYANIGTIYSEQGNFTQALEWFNKGLNPIRPQCWVLSNIANTYTNMGNYPKALEYLNKCVAIAEQMNPETGRDGDIAGAFLQIGNVYREQNDFALALEFYQKALNIIDSPQNT